MKELLIGESSWDLEVFSKCNRVPDYYILHNDFFKKNSNKRNTRIIKRIINFLVIFGYVMISLIKGRIIYFSSLNSEAMLVALVFSKSKKTKFFIPNVIGDPDWYGRLLQYCLKRYKGKILVSDKVTFSYLSCYGCSSFNSLYSFEIPKKSELNNLIYIVVLPAGLSHKNIEKNVALDCYEFSFSIYKLLKSYGHEVYALPHPRDYEYIHDISSRANVIDSTEIKKFGSRVCYISGHSSLSLNRRYGGAYGVWVSIGKFEGLHPSLKSQKSKLVDIEYFSRGSVSTL